MSDPGSYPLSNQWKDRLGLENRKTPELYEAEEAVIDAPHGNAIRLALTDLGLSAIFSVEGVPTIAILSTEQYDRNRIVDLHAALWNQGLASILFVIAGDTLRAFSLARTPSKDLGKEFESRCLFATLDATADALELKHFVNGVESGRLWNERAEYFNPRERVDQVLLDNLTESYRLLRDVALSSGEAQALLIQTMFIAYLEDRQIITSDYIRRACQEKADSFSSLLATKNVKLLGMLFAVLRKHFNGDLFVAPCSFEFKGKAPTLSGIHLDVIARFRAGREEMDGEAGQYRFWGYNFRYIPIELISAVYDRFLGENEEARHEEGAYYTPMFLADTVVSQTWNLLPASAKEKARMLDPACGSGVFLVRFFQRLCEHWKATRAVRKIRWDSLLSILRRLYGWDVNANAVRVAVFSLYVALLEEVSPPDIHSLIEQGKLLPELWGNNLVRRDFFALGEEQASFDVIIGNPPWSSRHGPDRPSVQWCVRNNLPMPSREDAWAFVWKARCHLANDGIVSFLLPAMGFLHNHASDAICARNRLIQENQVYRIINFADLRFQLFDGPVRPAALFIFGKKKHAEASYGFDYWAPKADANLRIKRLITLRRTDKMTLGSATVMSDPLVFKRRLWMNEPESKLFSYFSQFPTLRDLAKDYGNLGRKHRQVSQEKWIIGQGFQPFNRGASTSSFSVSRYVGTIAHLPIQAFRRFAQPVKGLRPWHSHRVRRKGFELGFTGPRILVTRTVETSRVRMRATYTEAALTFQDIIQAIVIPSGDKAKAKLLTALLNSSVAAWYAFHSTASFGSERPEVKPSELLRFPFPEPADLPEPKCAEAAAEELVALVENTARAADSFSLYDEDNAIFREVDRLAYEYFCLSDDEKALIEDTIQSIIPAVQPRRGSYPGLWKSPLFRERRQYAETLTRNLKAWFQEDCKVSASLEAKNEDLGVLKLALESANGPTSYTEKSDRDFDQSLSRISEQLHQPLGMNFQLVPDFRIFVAGSLYLVKPMQRRFWLRSAAMADSDSIALDLQDAVELDMRQRQN